VLLLAFAGVLLAVLLRNLARMIATHTPLPVGAGLAVTALGIVGALAGVATLAGPRIAGEAVTLFQQLPEAVSSVETELGHTPWGSFLLDSMEGGGGGGGGFDILGTVTGTVSTILSLAVNVFIVIAVALFLASDPGLYRRGAMHLVAPAHRARAGEVLDALGRGLWAWMIGQALAMVVVGALVFAGLWLIGVPLAFTLALIAGLTNFIPFVGPFLGAAPALLMAVPEGVGTVVWVALLFTGVQQLEGNLITPMIQRRAAALPPVLIILAVVAAGLLFGLLGVFLATPLLLTLMVLVRMLYVEDVLDDQSAEKGAPGAE
jgi:predicted PurR-regulated permease PerM